MAAYHYPTMNRSDWLMSTPPPTLAPLNCRLEMKKVGSQSPSIDFQIYDLISNKSVIIFNRMDKTILLLCSGLVVWCIKWEKEQDNSIKFQKNLILHRHYNMIVLYLLGIKKGGGGGVGFSKKKEGFNALTTT